MVADLYESIRKTGVRAKRSQEGSPEAKRPSRKIRYRYPTVMLTSRAFRLALCVLVSTVFVALGTAGLAARFASQAAPAAPGVEKHLKNVRQLTQGGENAEAYFSQDGTRLIYQSTRP